MMYPNQEDLTKIVYQLRQLLFPEHFGHGGSAAEIGTLLKEQVRLSLGHRKQPVQGEAGEAAGKITETFFENLPALKSAMLMDAEAGFYGDPAAYSVDEVILAYPGFFAILIYRMAHALSLLDVPLIPRMMCEYAHSKTGIDIHPGAEIGERFFIDHGTGVVIGETAKIGNRVKLYQGVTIGALSTKNPNRLSGKKRHPTLEDDVVIYAGTAILGGETVIGRGATIGGNAFIIESVLPESKVSGARPASSG